MDQNPAKRMQYVNTGDVSSGGIETILNSGAIGSCVVVTAFDSIKNMGAMAHILLPEWSPSKDHVNATKYAANALNKLLSKMISPDDKTRHLEFCLIGGANVLKHENDSIGKNNLSSVKKLLSDKHIEVKAESIGGFERRTVIFDIGMGCIYYTVGDSKQKILWQTGNK